MGLAPVRPIKSELIKTTLLLITVLLGVLQPCHAQFVHPGGLHTQADLDRMKTKVAAGEQPWLAGWQELIRDPLAQHTYKASPAPNMNVRQVISKDAHAAYLNAIRWYVSGDERHADCAIRIFNDYSSTLNQIPSGGNTDIVGLGGIGISELAMAAEVMRICDRWQKNDFDRFKKMMANYLYPVCHDFLVNHNGACVSYHWANWDANNIAALIAIGVLCDDTNIFNEGVEYFKHGKGMGCITNAVPFRYSDNFGQWQESGRDQEHAQLGIGLLGNACQIAWNQGIDLFGYDNNRLLAGAEYVAKCNLSYPASTIPYTFYNNCANARQFYISINELGRLDDRPVWELIYNHYAVLKGLSAPYSKAMAQLMRPEHGSNKDHFGYGTLTFTRDAAASPYPPSPIPPVPTGLKAEGGVSQVFLNWEKSSDDTAQGYVVSRSTTLNGPFAKIARWNDHTLPQYIDTSASSGVTYYYAVAAVNQSGVSANSEPVGARAGAAGPLPSGWTNGVVGDVGAEGIATFSEAGQHTFIVKGTGGNIGGKTDALSFTRRAVTGDFTFTARFISVKWSGSDKVGLMVRESGSPEARTVALTVGQAGNRQCRFGTRAQPSGTMIWQAGNDYTWPPVWFRIERKGNVFTGYQSIDGTNWFKVGSSEAPLADECLVGFAITGQKPDAFNTSVFDHVVVEAAAK